MFLRNAAHSGQSGSVSIGICPVLKNLIGAVDQVEGAPAGCRQGQ